MSTLSSKPMALTCILFLLKGTAHLMTWTWALMTSVLETVKPSSTLFSSINFFQPQSCSFLQNLCSVSAHQKLIVSTALPSAHQGPQRYERAFNCEACTLQRQGTVSRRCSLT